MIIDTTIIRFLKDTPNSAYQLIKLEFLYHSNKLEGSTFSKENLNKYLNEQVIEGSHSFDDVMETANSSNVFDHIIETLEVPLNREFILDLHRTLKDRTLDHEREFAGCWKKISNQISGVDLKLAEPWEVEEGMEELIQEWNDSRKDCDAIVKFHARFENIHPFQDGNGRIGRFLMLKQCIENGVDLIMIDDVYSKEYKSALYGAQKNQNFEELKEVFANCQKRLDEKLEFLKQTLDYIQKYEVDMNPNQSM